MPHLRDKSAPITYKHLFLGLVLMNLITVAAVLTPNLRSQSSTASAQTLNSPPASANKITAPTLNGGQPQVLGANTGVNVAWQNINSDVNISGNTTLTNGKYLNIGSAYLSSGGSNAHLATNEYYTGSAWVTNGNAGLLLQEAGSSAFYFLYHDAGNPSTQTLLTSISNSGQLTAPYLSGSTNVSTPTLCLNGDCRSSWPSTTPTLGQNSCYWTAASGGNKPVYCQVGYYAAGHSCVSGACDGTQLYCCHP